MVFYLANATYTKKTTFDGFDQVWCPSHFLCDYYQNKLGIDPVVMRSILPERSFVSPSKVFPVTQPALRKQGFITYSNPSLQKGVILFLRLLDMKK
jgi:hypothetical protein